MSPTILKDFEFGLGAQYPRSHMRTFSAPAISPVAVTLKSIRIEDGPRQTPVYVEVMKPDGDSIGSGGPDGPVVFTQHVVPPESDLRIGELFQSEYGCTHTWRVRVKAVDLPFLARVSGQIKFSYDPPMPVDLLLDDRPSINPGRTWEGRMDTRVYFVEPDLFYGVYGAGVFSIKAKWHNLLGHGRASVTLINPDGDRVVSQEGYSQHANFISAPWGKINLFHRVTVNDARQYSPGLPWRIEVINRSNQIMWDFDLQSGLDPNLATNLFGSTFRGGC